MTFEHQTLWYWKDKAFCMASWKQLNNLSWLRCIFSWPCQWLWIILFTSWALCLLFFFRTVFPNDDHTLFLHLLITTVPPFPCNFHSFTKYLPFTVWMWIFRSNVWDCKGASINWFVPSLEKKQIWEIERVLMAEGERDGVWEELKRGIKYRPAWFLLVAVISSRWKEDNGC